MKHLYKALASFQQEVPIIHKGAEGYGYSYADLPAILPIINPLLKKYGLGFTQMVEGKTVVTIIFHSESGENIKSTTDIPQGVSLAKMNEFQVLGSAITYIRRYALSSILGLVTDKDIDANGEQVNKPKNTQQKNDKPWFNPTNKDGSISEAGKKWIDIMAEKGKEYAIKAVKEQKQFSKDTSKWMNEQSI
jgi:hypothetical protein